MSQSNPAQRAVLVLALLAGVVCVAVVVVFLAARRSTTTPPSAVTVVVTQTNSPQTSEAATGTAAPAQSADPQQQALQALNQARADALNGLALNGRWVLQLSSKRDGTVDEQQTAANGSHTFHYTDIRVQFDQLSTLAHTAGLTPIVLTANDFGTKRSPDGDQLWILLADPASRVTTKAAAQTACETLFPQASGAALSNSCVPRTLVPLP